MTNKKQRSTGQSMYDKRDLLYGKRDLHMTKETYIWQKRPIMWLETRQHQSQAPKAAPQQKQKRFFSKKEKPKAAPQQKKNEKKQPLRASLMRKKQCLAETCFQQVVFVSEKQI